MVCSVLSVEGKAVVDEAAPEQLREAAICFFREEELPETLWWVAHLNPLQLRLFSVQLSDTLKTALISGDDGPLCQTLESWEATAAVMSSPEVLAALERPVDEREYVSLSEFTE